ncbi:translation initiation factor IF-2-like isoform X2 [Aquila chrysaetos chrysaetos]|uniref:translation initiation factor IF-2-like isoform X2 n=1 Tax=Aquila chrysaetos chrysaetos TaxID=223781 RepID=UPI001176B161|nr:translation initiation factor IF-2-like isoform X2 [Aquila chrysaetos chrysaetos]
MRPPAPSSCLQPSLPRGHSPPPAPFPVPPRSSTPRIAPRGSAQPRGPRCQGKPRASVSPWYSRFPHGQHPQPPFQQPKGCGQEGGTPLALQNDALGCLLCDAGWDGGGVRVPLPARAVGWRLAAGTSGGTGVGRPAGMCTGRARLPGLGGMLPDHRGAPRLMGRSKADGVLEVGGMLELDGMLRGQRDAPRQMRMGCSRPAGCSEVDVDGMLEANGMVQASWMLPRSCHHPQKQGWPVPVPPPCMSSSSLCPQPPPAPLPGRTQRASRTRGVRARRNAPHNKHTVTPGPACVCPQPPSAQLRLVSPARGSRSGRHPAAPLSLHKPQ